ncbi:hypothetical protein ACISU4_18795 [Streptomyces wuyuanensis]|uniref:hypothetical protein n=1 Tax=Streptomyces wuyuanensis TaxID=1196353 RepID=UPI00382DC568
MVGTAAATFLVRLVTTGRLCGVGPGSSLGGAGAAVRGPFVDDVDTSGQCLRRDHGFVEFSFNPEGAGWVMSGMTLQLHRLAGNPGLARRFRDAVGVALPRTVPWPDLRASLSAERAAESPAVVDQGGFIEHRYRGPDVHASVLVNDDDHPPALRRGDVWSVDVWAARKTQA